MGSHRLTSDQTSSTRHDVRAVAMVRTPDGSEGTGHRGLSRVIGRLGVLGALVAVTLVIPVTQGAVGNPLADAATAASTPGVRLPSTVAALTAGLPSQLPPASLKSTTDVDTAEAIQTVSRSAERTALPGCAGGRPPAGVNGELPESSLCTLFDGHTQMRSDAAVAFAELNQAFVAQFGADLCLASGYRTLAQQRAVKAQKGGLAAAPGKSNHGWGLAVDLCSSETSGAHWAWLNENGPLYGMDNPAWARPGGSGPHEKWHWEYTKGVMEDGEYWDH